MKKLLFILVKYTKNNKVSVPLNAPKTQQLHFIVTQVGLSRLTNPLKSWEIRKFQMENQMVRAIPFGKLQKIRAVIWDDAIFLLF